MSCITVEGRRFKERVRGGHYLFVYFTFESILSYLKRKTNNTYFFIWIYGLGFPLLLLMTWPWREFYIIFTLSLILVPERTCPRWTWSTSRWTTTTTTTQRSGCWTSVSPPAGGTSWTTASTRGILANGKWGRVYRRQCCGSGLFFGSCLVNLDPDPTYRVDQKSWRVEFKLLFPRKWSEAYTNVITPFLLVWNIMFVSKSNLQFKMHSPGYFLPKNLSQ